MPKQFTNSRKLPTRFAATILGAFLVLGGSPAIASAAGKDTTGCGAQATAELRGIQREIDVHNAKPHVFVLPEQKAQYDAYNAEAARLNAQKGKALGSLRLCKPTGNDEAGRRIPQGFTERSFKRFAGAVRQLRTRARLPKGELAAHGSRIRGNARKTSDIDVALRVDNKTFFDLAERSLARARPGTRLRKSILRRVGNGQLSSFDLGPEFQTLKRDLLDPKSPYKTQFSVLRKGGKLDNGPWLPLK